MEITQSPESAGLTTRRSRRGGKGLRATLVGTACLAAAGCISLAVSSWQETQSRPLVSPLFTNAELLGEIRAIARRNPDDAHWQDRLAMSYVREGHFLSAAETLRRRLELGGPEKDARQALVFCLHQLERYDEAIPHLRRLAEVGRSSPEAQFALAEGLALAGKKAEAERVLDDMPRSADGYPVAPEASDVATLMERLAARYGRIGAWGKCLALGRKLLDDMPGRWGAHVIVGKSLLVLGKPEAAIPFLRQGQKAAPGDPDLQYLLASALQQRGRPADVPEIKKLLLSVLSKKRTHGRAWYEMGRICRTEGNWDRTAQSYQNARKLGVDPAVCLQVLGEAFQKLGNIEEGLYHTGLYYEAIEEPERALQQYRKLSGMHGHCVHGSIHMARALAKMNRNREALETLERARKQQGDSPRLLLELAAAYERVKDPARQRKCWEEFIKLDPENADLGYQNLGALADSEGKLDEAERHYRKCTELQPTSETYKMQLAQLLMEQKGSPGKLAEAVSLLEEAMRLARKSAQVHYVLGLAYAATSRHEEAVLALRHAVDLEPGDGRPYFPLSQSLAALGREDEAAAHLATYRQYRAYLEAQEVLAARARRAPGDTAVIERLAAFYERVGAVDNALEQYELLAKRAPRRADYQSRLATLYGEIGRLADQRRAEARAAHLLASAPSATAAGP